ncbi:hypothetical protein NDU88_002547 [Pleurodeles waltl]|uniref:Uncharacterized protein n=1 Tax=Pleurodeles waltl TaxID=8319 RepID=A0AAV7LCT4_PLEWA|nr:hypothetical protein NDU88_002547 [Pleurodeles waltl]
MHDPPLIDLSDTCAAAFLIESVASEACEGPINAAQPPNINATQGGEECLDNPTAILNQCTSSSSSSAEAYPFFNPRNPSVLAKQDHATGTALGCLEEPIVPADPSLEVKLKEDRPASGEAGASWQALLSPMDAMSAAIHYQADKQETQVELLSVLAVHIVSIDKKLQALNDLIRRAQTHSYTQRVLCQRASIGDNSPKTTEVLNDILTEVRAQAPRIQDRLHRR